MGNAEDVFWSVLVNSWACQGISRTFQETERGFRYILGVCRAFQKVSWTFKMVIRCASGSFRVVPRRKLGVPRTFQGFGGLQAFQEGSEKHKLVSGAFGGAF